MANDDWRRAKQRRKLSAQQVAAILNTPMHQARAALNSLCTLPPTAGRLRAAMVVERDLHKAVRDLAGHKSPVAHVGRSLLAKMRAYLNQPGALDCYPHLRCCPRGVDPWCGWRKHLTNIARERPQFSRARIEEDRRFLASQQAEMDCEVEVGEIIQGALPCEAVALLKEDL